jgi:hypothetical protein
LACEQSVVLGVRADPDPQKSGCFGHGKRAVVKPYARRPQLAGLLEMQGGVPRIAFQQAKL